MYKLLSALIFPLLISTQTAFAAPSIFREETDIAFRDIFETLEIKLERSADDVFYETQALKGLSNKTVETDSSDLTSYKYDYGINSNGQSIYREWGHKAVIFMAADYSTAYEKKCLTFKQAEIDLRKHGWARNKNAENSEVYDGENIFAAYVRRGVTFKIENFEMLVPWLEPFNSAEGNRQILAEAELRRQERLKIRRGTKAYDKTCVTSVIVEYTRG